MVGVRARSRTRSRNERRTDSNSTSSPTKDNPSEAPIPTTTVTTSILPSQVEPLPEGHEFGPAAFSLLFGEWPGYENSRFNEKRADAEAAFFKQINASNYPAFFRAWDTRLAAFQKDTAKDRRLVLGTFRTFCEGRWQDVKPAPAPAVAGVIDEDEFDLPWT
jgi:hypothetical protein